MSQTFPVNGKTFYLPADNTSKKRILATHGDAFLKDDASVSAGNYDTRIEQGDSHVVDTGVFYTGGTVQIKPAEETPRELLESA